MGASVSGNIQLGGRLFTLVNYMAITSLNEHYIMKVLSEAGIDKVLPPDDGLPSHEELRAALEAGNISPEEAARLAEKKQAADTEYIVMLQQRLVHSLRLHDLLAGWLLPLGKSESDWSLELARDTAAFLRQLNTPEDRETIHTLAVDVVMHFFRAGVASLQTSPRSSNGATPAETGQSQSQNAVH